VPGSGSGQREAKLNPAGHAANYQSGARWLPCGVDPQRCAELVEKLPQAASRSKLYRVRLQH
jgi:hypothetical protein